MMIRQFLDYLRFERNLSPLTVRKYGEDLTLFSRYIQKLDNHLSLESADSDLVRNWMESMMDKGNIATSINRRLSALRSFYRFALSRNIIKTDPTRLISGPKKARPLPHFLKESEMDRLLDTEELWSDSFSDVRARTILLTFYSTGVRVSELVGLDVESADLRSNRIKVTGKGNKQRVIPFGSELAGALDAYIRLRGERPVSSEALFVTDKGARMTHWQVRTMVEKALLKVTTQTKRSPHVLRHTFATAMINHGAGIESVKKLLGHESLNTTEVYTHTTFEQLKRVYKQAHPRA